VTKATVLVADAAGKQMLAPMSFVPNKPSTSLQTPLVDVKSWPNGMYRIALWASDGTSTLQVASALISLSKVCKPDCDGKTCKADGCGGVCMAACDDSNSCTKDACGPTGHCKHTKKTGACDDGNKCTVGDYCTTLSWKWKCRAGNKLLPCGDGNACTTDVCDAKKGCVSTPGTPWAACGNAGVCKTGKCVKWTGPPLGSHSVTLAGLKSGTPLAGVRGKNGFYLAGIGSGVSTVHQHYNVWAARFSQSVSDGERQLPRAQAIAVQRQEPVQLGLVHRHDRLLARLATGRNGLRKVGQVRRWEVQVASARLSRQTVKGSMLAANPSAGTTAWALRRKLVG